MSTTTDTKHWDATWTDTGEHPVVSEVASLDGAATDNRWLPGPNSMPDLSPLIRPTGHKDFADEPTPLAGVVPDIDDIRERGRMLNAELRLVKLLDAKAQLWHEVASQAWAHQGEISRISEGYSAKREALERLYERERDALIQGLRGPEYGGHVYDQQRGFVAAGQDDYPPPEHERQGQDPDLTPEHERPAEDREALNKLTKRVPTAISTEPATDVVAEAPTYNETTSEANLPWWRRAWIAVRDWDGRGA